MWNNLASELNARHTCKIRNNICSSLRSNHNPRLPKNQRQSQRGFSLVELMISVGIISILAGVAIPSYINFTKNGAVSEALATLMNLSTQMEKRFVDVRTYQKTEGTGCGIELPADKDDHYTFACSLTDGYTLTASSSSRDPDYRYTINSNGVRATTVFDGNASDEDCWQINNSGGCY